MKNLILSLVIALVGSNALSASQPLGNGTTWPFGKEIVFPWTKVNGIWQANLGQSTSDKSETYFVFKVGRVIATGEKIVKVTHYDPYSCTILGRGPATLAFGSSNASGKRKKYIEGKIKGTGGEFKVSVHAFRESDIKVSGEDRLVTDISNTVMVLKLVAAGDSEKEALDTQLIKISDKTEPDCE